MTRQSVVTWETILGQRVSLCRKHAAPETEAERDERGIAILQQVHYGAHPGTCDVCVPRCEDDD